MINIQKHIISEAFEQLAKKNKLKESIKSDLFRIFNSNGFDTSKESVKKYIDAAEEYIEMAQETEPTYSAEEWYNDTLRNVPEELNELRDDEDDTIEADWEDTTDVKFDESVQKTPILYVIKDKHGNQLSAPNSDDQELWDRVKSMQQRGRQGLKVVVYVPDKQAVDESVKYPNGELVTDIDLDTYLDYYYGEDRDKDISKYSSRDKQKATDYWFKKHDTPVNESKLKESTSESETQYLLKSDLEARGLDKSDIDDITLIIRDVGKYYAITGDPTNIWNVLYRYDLQWSTTDEIHESKLTEAPLTPAEYAAKARARKTSNPLQKINSQLNPDMTITDQLQVYFDELVPSSGKAKTVAGEIIRAIMRLMYRDYNDGDLWYTGYGKETCGSEVIYLINVLPDFAYDYFSRMAENSMEYAEYTDALEELAENIIVYLNENPQLFTQENTDDSRRHDYRKLTDIFSMPTYDYEPDVSYNPPEFNVDDDEIDQLIRDFVRSELSSGTVNRLARDAWTIEDLEKDDYDHAEEEFPMWFADFLEEHRREDEYDDDEDFDESLNKDNQKRGKDMNMVAEDFQLSNLDKMGTNEYEANKNRDKHIRMYRKFANISDSEPITEETINEYALDKTATYCNREPERIKAEILGQRYSEYEQE